MTEPIKLPPDLLAGTLVREGVNKHRARDIEQWMNEEMRLAVEQNTAELRAEVERLRADAERYQWLRARYRAMSMDMGGNHSWVPDGRVMRELRGPTLNAAIDAALKEPK